MSDTTTNDDAALAVVDASDLSVDTSRPVLQGLSKATLKKQESKTSDDGATIRLSFQWELQDETAIVGADRKMPPGGMVFQSFAVKAPNEAQVRMGNEDLARTLKAVHGLKENTVKITRDLITSAVGKSALLDLKPRTSKKDGETYQDIKVKPL